MRKLRTYIIISIMPVESRVREVPPFVIFHPDEEPGYGVLSEQPMGPHRLARPAFPRPFFDDNGPVGWQDPDREPKKKALFLSPYQWQLGNDGSEEILSLLSNTRDYDCEGCINYVPNPDNPLERMAGNLQVVLGIDIFLGWNEYDLIHIISHGRQVCQSNLDSGCMFLLLTGRYVTKLSVIQQGEFKPYPGILDGASSKLPSGWRKEYVSSDFFRSVYPGGLPDTLIFFQACQSMKSAGLSESLSSNNTTVLGWSESVRIPSALEIATKFYTNFVSNGLRSEAAFEKTKGFSGYQFGFGQADADLLMRGSKDTRGREVITLMHPIYLTEFKNDSAAITQDIAGDGERDLLFLAVQIEGVDQNLTPADDEIHLSVDGNEVNQTYTADRSTGEYEYQTGLIAIPLPLDVDNKKTIVLEAWAELTGGGTTRHYLESVVPAGCGWKGVGEFAGSLM